MSDKHLVDRNLFWVDGKQIEFWRISPRNINEKLPNLIFIHGWGLSPQSYLKLLTEISGNQFTVIAPSLPGFGGSDSLNLSREAYNETVEHLFEGLKQQGILDEENFFVGHSFGAGLSVSIVEKSPHLTNKMVLLCPIGGTPGNPLSWLKLLAGLRHEWGNSSVDRAKDALPSFLKNPLYLASSGIAAKNMDLMNSLHMVTGHHGVPVTVIAANNDGVVPIGNLQKIEKLDITIVEGNHGWPLSNIVECSALIHESIHKNKTSSQSL